MLRWGRDALREGPRLRKEFEGYTRLEVTVDSGAAASVIPEKLLPGHAIRPSEGSKAGVHYLAADGGRIPNLGEVGVAFLTKEQHRCRMAFQVANVKRPLLAVSTLTRTGNDVAFTAGGGTITNRKTGRNISFSRKGGVYVLEVMVAPPPGRPGPANSLAALGKSELPAAGVGRPGAVMSTIL